MSGEDEIARQVAEAKEAAEAKKGPDSSSQQKGAAERKDRKRRRAFPFKNEDGHLWRETETEGEDGAKSKRWVPIGSELHVRALTRSAEGEDWGRLVEVIDRDGARHLWAVPQAMHAGSGEAIFSELLRLGWEPASGRGRKWRDDLRDFLLWAEPDKRVRCVVRIGWNGEAYVLPDGAISAAPSAEEVILQAAERIDHALNVAGTLAEWQVEIAAKVTGNSRLVLAVSAAFAAPLLAITGDDGGGFHLRGASSSGKSTALAVAGSVWGGGGTRGYVQSWRATDNGLEALSSLHNDCLLCLDELSQIDSKAAGQAAYMLGNGVGKARAGREGQARKSHDWRLLFLSNGEVGLADKISESGGRIAAGMEVRVIDLRADAGAGLGVFEDLHGASDPSSFAQGLKSAAGRVYGSAARAFLRNVAADLSKVRETVTSARKAFLSVALPSGADGQVRRVADRFALVAAAGELATALGVTGWPEGVPVGAALRCFRDWLAERGGIGASEVSDAKARLRREIEVNGHSRFLPWRPDSRTVVRTNALGFVQRPEDEQSDTATVYYFHTSGLKEVLSGLDQKTVREALADEGIIVRHETKDGKGYKIEKPFKVPFDKAVHRLYQIDFASLTAVVGETDG